MRLRIAVLVVATLGVGMDTTLGRPFRSSIQTAKPEDPPDSTGAAIRFDVVYTGDVVANVRGGLRRDVAYLDNADVTLTLDLEHLVRWDGASLFFYGLGNQGGDPSSFIGDAQTVNNIEAVNAWRLYEAWYQQLVLRDHVSMLVGLYDLNSEFDVSQAASLFINSSFGIGAEFGLSGRNGPSIFPVTSFGGRVRAVPHRSVYVQAAVLDGIPGSLSNPRGTHVIFGEDDGVLLTGEVGYVMDHAASVEGPRRRVSRLQEADHQAKLAVGVWHYTTTFERMLDVAKEGDLRRQSGNTGVYVLGEWRTYREAGDRSQGLDCFARAGIADHRVNRFSAYTGGGCVYTGLLPRRGMDPMGFAVAAAHNSDDFMTAQRRASQPVDASEVAIEFTYGAIVTEQFTVQADVQYVIHPNTDVTLDNALVTGLRVQYVF